jgi:hypothetical protein
MLSPPAFEHRVSYVYNFLLTFVCADLDLGEVEVPMMPSEEEIARMREECAQLGAEEYHRDAHLADLDTSEQQQDEAKGGKGRFLSLCAVHEMYGN